MMASHVFYLHGQKLDISYLLEAVHDVIRVLDTHRLLNTSNGERVFQLLMSKLDFLQRIVVNPDIDDLATEMIGMAYSLMVETENANQSQCGARLQIRASVHGGGIRRMQ